MVTRVVKLNDFARVLEQHKDKHISEVKKRTVDAIAQSLPILASTSPVDTGLYAASWDMTMDEKSIFLGNTAPHAPIIEEGARPFFAPIGPLLAWAKRVLQDPGQPPEYSSAVWALAKYTQNKIAEQGMMPKHVLANALPDILERIRQELNR